MGRCYTPSGGPSAWRNFLAKPDMHWKTGYSAKTLAYCWEAENRLPREIAALIKTVPRYQDEEPELLVAIPEWKVSLPGGSAKSQNDILALIGIGDDLMVAVIEGKVSEPFDDPIEEWYVNPSKGKTKRLQYLCDLLGMAFPPKGHLRYQLLHRAASAIIECKRFRGRTPAMIVHSFSPEKKWFEDYSVFVGELGGASEPDRMTEVLVSEGFGLLLGWACGDPVNLNA